MAEREELRAGWTGGSLSETETLGDKTRRPSGDRAGFSAPSSVHLYELGEAIRIGHSFVCLVLFLNVGHWTLDRDPSQLHQYEAKNTIYPKLWINN